MADAATFTEEERQRVTNLLSRPLFFPEEFKKWLPDWLAQNMPVVPVYALQGYKATRAGYDEVLNDAGTVEAAPDSAWGTQATPHPTVENLTDGNYLVIWGAYFEGGDQSSGGYIGISINGSTPTNELSAFGDPLLDDGLWVSRAHVFEVTGGANGLNTLEAKIKLVDNSGAGTILYGSRYMVTLRAF